MQDLSLEGDNYDKQAYVEKNFAQKILESDEEILQRYDELKNFILLYKGVKSRVSNDFDSFNMGRTQLFKLGFSTKSLKLYLNLEYDKVETRLKCKDVSSKKAYKEVPVFLRIKSPRAMRNAKYLIEQVAKRFELKENPRAVYVDSIKILKEKAKTYN
jgi:predicted transport protein